MLNSTMRSRTVVKFDPRALALTAFIAVSAASCAFLVPDYRASCRDGWSSSSIGRQGACSHHGGVKSNKTMRMLARLGGLGLGGLAGLLVLAVLSKRGWPKEEPSEVSVDRAAPETSMPSAARDDVDPTGLELIPFVEDARDQDDPVDEDEPPSGPFKCPQCGYERGREGVLRSPGPPTADPWSHVLSTLICEDCNAEIPEHLAERWGGITYAEARKSWARFRRFGSNRAKNFGQQAKTQRNHESWNVEKKPVNRETASAAERPYRRLGVEALEALFAESASGHAVLDILASELTHRDTARARTLLAKVRELMAQNGRGTTDP